MAFYNRQEIVNWMNRDIDHYSIDQVFRKLYKSMAYDFLDLFVELLGYVNHSHLFQIMVEEIHEGSRCVGVDNDIYIMTVFAHCVLNEFTPPRLPEHLEPNSKKTTRALKKLF